MTSFQLRGDWHWISHIQYRLKWFLRLISIASRLENVW